jgi:tetratricopeptide (TPR) repeat protein
MKKFAPFILGLICLWTSTLSAQQGRGKIRGLVLDEGTGQPLAGVTVKMFMPILNTFFQPSPVTDKEGYWSANFLRTGKWTLEFDKVGYAPQTVSYNVVFDPGALKEVLTVKLRQIKGLIVKDAIVVEARKADQLLSEKKYPEARAILGKIIAEYPEAYILYKNIGNTYFAEENYEKAIASYMQVYEKAPDRADVVAAIANAYNNMGKKDEAAAWYRKLTVGDVRDIDTAYNAGVTLYNAGNPGEAVNFFKKSVEIDPNFADGYYQLGMASVALGKNDEAIVAFQKFLSIAPDAPQAATAKTILEALTKK